MENEENRGLINKKASKDQLVPFVRVFWELSHYSLPLSLSHSWTLRVFLENFGIGSRKSKKERGREQKARKSMIKEIQYDSLQVFPCMCDFITRFGMHGIACGFFFMIYHWHGGLPRFTVDLPSLAISWITTVLWVHFIAFFSGWLSCDFGCGLSYQFLEALVGQKI